MVEVLPLQEEAAAQLLGQPVALGERRRPAGVVRQEDVQLGPEPLIGPRLPEGGLELLAGGHQGLGHEATAEAAEPPHRTGIGEDLWFAAHSPISDSQS